MTSSKALLCATASIALLSSTAAFADDAAAPAAPAAPAGYWDSFTFGAEAEVGITGNPDDNHSGVNFGHLFTDKENQVLLNQLSLTAARPVDPKATGFDWGFRLEGMYGTDARYTHFLGEFTHVTADRAQLDIVEASLSAHLPALTSGGVDVKFGQYPTPIGFEVIEPSLNPFYSHSYIFNFGIPLKHTGGYATAHLNDTFDLWLGGDTGVNTSLETGDNNTNPAFLGGIGINGLLGGNLTILALTHIGPENASIIAPFVNFNPNKSLRYLNDIVVTYKASDALTFTTELNYIQDDGFHAHGYGIAQYASYTLNDNLTLNGRGEVFHDSGFFVGAFPHNQDFVDSEEGLPNSSFGFTRTTYSEWTVGLTYKPDVPDVVKGLMIRPELRYDTSLDGHEVYKDGSSNDQFTAGLDLILPVAIYPQPSPAVPAPAAPAAAPPPATPPVAAIEPQRSFQVFFDFDKSNITSAAAQVIQAAADAVKSGHVVEVMVTGHTDTVGSAKYNQALSERRATAVKKQLVSDGVASGEITTTGVGKTGLLVPTADGVREPQNRRAEIVEK
jgi:outer membrane protein OmpA-like peptidoglycan-associated protein